MHFDWIIFMTIHQLKVNDAEPNVNLRFPLDCLVKTTFEAPFFSNLSLFAFTTNFTAHMTLM